jgi:hypothetical protein
MHVLYSWPFKRTVIDNSGQDSDYRQQNVKIALNLNPSFVRRRLLKILFSTRTIEVKSNKYLVLPLWYLISRDGSVSSAREFIRMSGRDHLLPISCPG